MSKPRYAPNCMAKKTGTVVLLLAETFVKAGKYCSLNSYILLEPAVNSSQLSHLLENVKQCFLNRRLHFRVPFLHPRAAKMSKVLGRVTRRHC